MRKQFKRRFPAVADTRCDPEDFTFGNLTSTARGIEEMRGDGPASIPDALDLTTGATGAAPSPRYAPVIIQPRPVTGSGGVFSSAISTGEEKC